MVPCEQFRGDFSALAALMEASWSQNPKESLHYTAPFLRSMFDQPGASLRLSAALYDGDVLVAFGAAFPRKAISGGRELRLAVDSFITVAPQLKGRGFGGMIWNHLVQAAAAENFHGLITYCVEGDLMDRKLERFSESYGHTTARVREVRYLARPVPQRTDARKLFADPAVLVRNEQTGGGPDTLERTWTMEEADWQCTKRHGAFGCRLDAGTVAAYAMPTLGPKSALCGLVDDILYPGPDTENRKALVALLIESAAAHGVQVLLVPESHAVDLTAFRLAGFRQTSRKLNMYMTTTSDALQLCPLKRSSIDVF